MTTSTAPNEQRVMPQRPTPPERRAPASPVALYKQARGEGASHARAIEVVIQAYPFM